MKKLKIYIAGKIGDLGEDGARAHFDRAQYELKIRLAYGFFRGYTQDQLEFVSPLDLPHDHDKSWKSYMLEDLKALSECDAILMVHNWWDSPGACIEHAFAQRAGLKVYYQ